MGWGSFAKKLSNIAKQQEEVDHSEHTANVQVAMSAVLNLTAAKIKEVFQKESPGVNVEKGLEVLMLLKGLKLEEKPDIPSTHSDHWKMF